MNREVQAALAEFYGEMKWHFLAEGEIIREHSWYAKGLATCLKLGIAPRLISGIEDRIVNDKYMNKKDSYFYSLPEEVIKIAA
jgi:hypothetical protein